LHPADQAVGAPRCDTPHPAAAQVLLDLAAEVDLDAALALAPDLEGVVDLPQVPLLELHVERGPDDLDDRAGLAVVRGGNHGCSVVGRICDASLIMRASTD